jgi:hypothetical protein
MNGGAASRFAGAALAGFAAVLAGAVAAAEPGFHPIEVTTRPIDRFLMTHSDQTFGPLEFRGGLELVSPSREFGSLSGLDFSRDGSVIYAVSDKGRWFSARPMIEGGRLTGLTGAGMAPMLNGSGEPLVGKRWGDAEGLRIIDRNGWPVALVSFEQANDLRAFAGADFVLARSVDVPLPEAAKAVSRNAGFEAVAEAPAAGPLGGGIVLIAEHTLDANGNHRGWIVGGPRNGAFALRRAGDFDVTDAAFLPDGDLLVLERRIAFPFGVGMRLRRIAAEDIGPGRTVDGEELLNADFRHQIDNMEGLAVGRGPKGETIVALVSDNNQSKLQRTLLLYFALRPDGPTAAGAAAKGESGSGS